MPVDLSIIESTIELGQTVVEVVLESASEPGPAGPGVPVGGADGQVLTKTAATDYATAWEDPTGGAGGGVTDADLAAMLDQAVVLAPAASTRNVIQPSAGDVIAAVVKAHAAQSVSLTEWQKSDETPLAWFGRRGDLRVQADFSGVSGADAAAMSALVLYPNLAGADPDPADFGAFFGVDSEPATHLTWSGELSRFYGMFTYPQHYGPGTIDWIIGGLFGAKLGTQGGPVNALLGANFVVENINVSRTIANAYCVYVDPPYVGASGTAFTQHTGIFIDNQGSARITAATALHIAAQSGSATTYAVKVDGGKSLFTDGILIARVAAPADAYFANGEGGWWWDQANSLPKWKGKTAGGVVVNFVPADASALSDHIADTADAHDASAISFSPAGTIAATDVQAAIEEVASEAAPGGGIMHVCVLPVALFATSFPWTNMPLAETFFFGTERTRFRLDLTNYTQMRWSFCLGVAGASGALLKVHYSTTESGAGSAIDGGTGTQLVIDSASSSVRKTSDWVDLEAGAKADVWIVIRGSGGDGAADPAFVGMYLEFR